MHHHSGAPILQNAPNDPLSQIPLWFQKLEDEPNIIRAKLDPKIVEQIQMVSSQENGSRRDHLGPEEKVAIVINNNLIIAVTTLGTLQKGSFDINYKLNDEERKIFINTLKESEKITKRWIWRWRNDGSLTRITCHCTILERTLVNFLAEHSQAPLHAENRIRFRRRF